MPHIPIPNGCVAGVVTHRDAEPGTDTKLPGSPVQPFGGFSSMDEELHVSSEAMIRLAAILLILHQLMLIS
jgi:hypothetical protein